MSFEKAIADSKKLTSKPSNEELLDLYGANLKAWQSYPEHPIDNSAALFKIANGEDISKAPAPGMFDLKVRSDSLGPLAPPPMLSLVARVANKKLSFCQGIPSTPANNVCFYPPHRARQRRTPGRRRSTRTSPRSRPRSSTSPSSRSSRPSTDTTRTRSQRPLATKRGLPAGVK